jgi:hypothetical protein
LKEVKEALAEPNNKKQEAVALFVQSLDPPSKFQQSMANLLEHLADSPVAKDIGGFTSAEANLNLGLDVPSTVASGNSSLGWNYDVFFCEHPNKDQNQSIAQAVVNDLKLQKGLGRIRMRLLPAALGNKPPYNTVHDYVILRHPNKEVQAKQLLGWLNAADSLPKFVIKDSDRELPGYLSAFVCPEAK